MKDFQTFLSTAPVAAAITIISIVSFAYLLNYWYPGLQYGTLFH